MIQQKPPIRILVVEDELIVAENIAKNLGKMGYVVVGIVDSGEEAIKQAAIQCPDIVLMDIMLQGEIDGIIAAGRINKDLQCPIIYMTAYADDTTLERAKETNPYGYLVKPFQPLNIRTTIEIAIQKHRTDTAKEAKYLDQLESVKEKLKDVANRDILTNLLNRRSLDEEFRQVEGVFREMLQEESPHKGQKPSPLMPILCMSIDRFERLKDNLGYEQCDRLLSQIAQRLDAHIGTNGILGVVGVNEFAVIWQPVDYQSQAIHIAQDLLQVLAPPFNIDGQEIFLAASIGGVFFPRNGETLEVLLQSGRKVINYLQQQGGNRCQFYTPLLKTSSNDQLALEADLHYALERKELFIEYQPKVSLRTGKICGAEALLRWQHPKKGVIPPLQFIGMAEETGLILAIGEWVLKNVCMHIDAWQAMKLHPITVAVNLSVSQLRETDVHQKLAQILAEKKINPQLIELEVSESALIGDVGTTNRRLTSLKSLGFQLVSDDLGTGYFSLNYLHEFPFDILKIDRSLVKGISPTSKNTAIVKSVIAMAHELKMRVVGEGVETPEELMFLYENKCDEIQGYIFSRPVSVAQFTELYKSGKGLAIRRA